MGTLQEMRMRRILCDAMIRELMKMDDPRRDDALEHYRAQLARIDGKIAEMEKAERQRLGLPEPEPVIVGLHSATLSGSIPR